MKILHHLFSSTPHLLLYLQLPLTRLHLRGRFKDIYPYLLANSLRLEKELATKWIFFSLYVGPAQYSPYIESPPQYIDEPAYHHSEANGYHLDKTVGSANQGRLTCPE